MSDLPFVTCLCLTKGRKEWLPGVVASFLTQDYAGRSELLIVADSWEDIPEGVGVIGFDKGPFAVKRRVQFGREISIVFELGAVGKKRNTGAEWSAKGSIISIWDDDDYSAPGRLTQQVETLLSTRAAVTGYTGLKFTDGRDWWRFNYHRVPGTGCEACSHENCMTCWPDSPHCGNRANPGRYDYVHATSLCFRRDWWETHPFEETQVGQDERFALAASAADQLAPCPDLCLMYATIHPGNTSPRVRINGALVGSNWEPLPGYVSPHPSVFPLSLSHHTIPL